MDQLIKLLIFLSVFEFIPFIMATIFGCNYGATSIGKNHLALNQKIKLHYISWLSFDILMVILLYSIYKNTNINLKTKLCLIALIFILTYSAVYPILQLGNLLFEHVFHNPPFIQDRFKHFPVSRILEDNYETIKQEFLKNYKETTCIHNTVPGFQISTGDDKKCWRTIVLKKQGTLTPDSNNFPKLAHLLTDVNIHNAIFSILDGNVNIPPHTGYYKGYLRYHLGIAIPRENNKRPFINCGGETYYWKNGEGVLFDDMYEHYVENPTTQQRVVLYLDVLRNDVPQQCKGVYTFFNHYIENHIVLKKIIGVQHQTIKN